LGAASLVRMTPDAKCLMLVYKRDDF